MRGAVSDTKLLVRPALALLCLRTDKRHHSCVLCARASGQCVAGRIAAGPVLHFTPYVVVVPGACMRGWMLVVALVPLTSDLAADLRACGSRCQIAEVKCNRAGAGVRSLHLFASQ